MKLVRVYLVRKSNVVLAVMGFDAVSRTREAISSAPSLDGNYPAC